MSDQYQFSPQEEHLVGNTSSKKTILYAAIGTIVVVLLVAGVFWFGRQYGGGSQKNSSSTPSASVVASVSSVSTASSSVVSSNTSSNSSALSSSSASIATSSSASSTQSSTASQPASETRPGYWKSSRYWPNLSFSYDVNKWAPPSVQTFEEQRVESESVSLTSKTDNLILKITVVKKLPGAVGYAGYCDGTFQEVDSKHEEIGNGWYRFRYELNTRGYTKNMSACQSGALGALQPNYTSLANNGEAPLLIVNLVRINQNNATPLTQSEKVIADEMVRTIKY